MITPWVTVDNPTACTAQALVLHFKSVRPHMRAREHGGAGGDAERTASDPSGLLILGAPCLCEAVFARHIFGARQIVGRELQGRGCHLTAADGLSCPDSVTVMQCQGCTARPDAFSNSMLSGCGKRGLHWGPPLIFAPQCNSMTCTPDHTPISAARLLASPPRCHPAHTLQGLPRS